MSRSSGSGGTGLRRQQCSQKMDSLRSALVNVVYFHIAQIKKHPQEERPSRGLQCRMIDLTYSPQTIVVTEPTTPRMFFTL